MMELTGENFKSETAKGWVVVDFWAPWCGPCRMLGPVVEKLSKDMHGKVKFGKVNVDEQNELAEEYEVSSIPTIVLMKDGKIVQQRVGAGTEAAIKSWIEQNMG